MASNTDDPYFGYTSTGNKQLTQMQQLQHHVGEDLMHYPEADTSKLPQYEPTINWADSKYSDDKGNSIKSDYTRQAGADTIEVINRRFASQSPEEVDKLQDQWFKVSMVIENLRDSITNEAQALAKTWKGDGANAFLMRGPGAAAKSLDDWYSCAITNSLGLIYLASTIRDYRAQMDVLYAKYKSDMVSFSNGWPSNIHHSRADYYKYQGSDDPKKDHADQYLSDLRDHAEQWNVQARALQYSMAHEYWQVINEHLNSGSSTVYEGPTDAVMADPKLLLNVPSVPNVNVPNVPSVPNVPTVPNVPQLPQVPDLSNVPDVPNTQNVPVVPDVTVPSTANLVAHEMPDVSVPNVPNLQGLQVDPSLLMNPSMLTTGLPLEGMPTSGMANPTNLTGLGKGLGLPPNTARLVKGTLGKATPPEGEGLGQGRGQMPPNTLRSKAATPPQQRPLVPGAEEEEFGRPGGLGSAPPVLRGRSGTPGGRRPAVPDDNAANRAGTPARPGSSPPVLNRKRQGGPGQQGGAPMGPTGPVDDETLNPGRPGTSRPVLRGTRLGQGGSPEEPQPPARALRGARRPAGVTEPEMASRRKNVEPRRDEEHERVDREFEKIQKLLGAEDPWTVQTPGGTVLDNAPERQAYQVEPKPTLRGNATG